MQKTRIPNFWLVLPLCVLAPPSALALGFGNSTPAATLGQPLDFTVSLRLEPGETVEPECVRAEVSIGDVPLAAGGVGASLASESGGGRAVRVRTQQRIDEPVVSVQVSVGCSQTLSRRFVVFADPPVVSLPPVVAQVAAPAAVPTAAATPAPQAPVAQVAQVAQANPLRAAAAASAAAPAPRPRPPRATQVVDRPAAPARPRLRLEAPPPPPPAPAPVAAQPLPTDAMVVVEQANEAVKAAIAAASASQGRIAALEANMQQLSAGAAAQRDMIETLRARAEAAETRNHWTGPLGLAVLALLALAAWLYVRLRELERDRQQAWLAAAQGPAAAAPPPAPPIPPRPSQLPLLVERSVRTAGVAALGAGLAPAHEPAPSEFPDSGPPTAPQEWQTPEVATLRTQPLPQSALAEMEMRAVSAEELIDLEQQAEFFVVLGQDDAAIDLLVSHLRDTGGSSPLPYLKLLDIYRRLGDRAAYERTRDRFNHRFNAHVPDWDEPVGEGRALEDYPAVVGWLQRVWPKPLDAMAELESLLFRKDGGELFDLPAYRELLLLYALARDLLDGDGSGSNGQTVDVLLPLNDSPGFAPTSPRPYFGDEEPVRADMQPTAPVDLDLDIPADPIDNRFGRYR
jgi:hypothetical protein